MQRLDVLHRVVVFLSRAGNRQSDRRRRRRRRIVAVFFLLLLLNSWEIFHGLFLLRRFSVFGAVALWRVVLRRGLGAVGDSSQGDRRDGEDDEEHQHRAGADPGVKVRARKWGE